MKRSFLLLTMFLTVVACVEPNNGLNNPDDNPPHTSKKPLLESISSNDLGDSYKRCFIYDEKDNTLLSFGEQWSTGYIKYEFSEDRSSIQYKYENFSGEVNKSMTYTDIEYDTAGNIRSMKWTSLGPGGVVSNNFTAMYKDGYLTSTTIVSEVANYQKTINSTLSYEDGIIKTLSTESKEGTDTFRIDVNFNSTQSQPNPFYQFDIIPLVYLFIPSNFGDIFVCLASAGLLGHYSRKLPSSADVYFYGPDTCHDIYSISTSFDNMCIKESHFIHHDKSLELSEYSINFNYYEYSQE